MNLVSSISVYPRIGISRSASETDVKSLFIFSEQIGLAASEVFYNHIYDDKTLKYLCTERNN